MASYSCQNCDFSTNWCRRLQRLCVPGRAGCVLRGKVRFMYDADERARVVDEEYRLKQKAARFNWLKGRGATEPQPDGESH